MMKRMLIAAFKTAIATVVGYNVAEAVAGSVNSTAPGQPNEYITRQEATTAGACGALAAVAAVGLFNRLTQRFVR